jgi:hypothetical protein
LSAQRSADVRALADDINARLDPAADALPSSDVEELYRSMPIEALVMVREAFTLDRDRGTANPAFCTHRIELLNRLLAERRQPD